MAFKVNIDCGHGSNTAGKRTAPFTKNVDINGDGKIDVKKGEQYREHYANVAVAIELEKELKRCGIEVSKTGWNDSNSKDDEDTALSTRQKAIKAAKCDVSVSIHYNAAGNANEFSSAEGVSTHIHDNSSRVGDSKKLADLVQAQLIKGTTQKNRGVVKQELAMCNCSAMGVKAAILVELAFMTNAREAMELMANSKHHKESAREIAQGICSYLGVKYKSESSSASSSTSSTTSASSTTKRNSYIVKVLVDELNIRKGPGTSYAIAGTVKKDQAFTIVKTNGNWGKLKSGAGWISVSSKYVKKC